MLLASHLFLLCMQLMLTFIIPESEADTHCYICLCVVQWYSFFGIAERNVIASNVEIKSFRIEVEQNAHRLSYI